jgi:hypothetical protein
LLIILFTSLNTLRSTVFTIESLNLSIIGSNFLHCCCYFAMGFCLSSHVAERFCFHRWLDNHPLLIIP